METNTSRAEAERLLGIAEKLLQGKDFAGCRDFAILAHETEPLLEGSDQILAVVEVLLAAATRINNQHDWYSILKVERRSSDLEVMKKQFRRLAFLLHPDKNKFPFADAAFRLVADAWAVLSDAAKKSMYDSQLGMFSMVDFVNSKNPRGQPPSQQQRQYPQFHREQEEAQPQKQKIPPKRSSARAAEAGNSSARRGSGQKKQSNFWTACPYCYNLYEYPRAYVDCCLKCQNCWKSFHAAEIPSLPQVVPGKDAYHFCWGFFPMGFKAGSGVTAEQNDGGEPGGEAGVSEANATPAAVVKRKRGRPRKNVQV